MHERPEDLAALQTLIDDSYAHANPHLLGIHEPARRLSAQAVADELTGMRLLVLATTTRDGRPITGPVDGVFHRGRFHFGSSPQSFGFGTSANGRRSASRTCPASTSRSPCTAPPR
jgi:hypothetical protein